METPSNSYTTLIKVWFYIYVRFFIIIRCLLIIYAFQTVHYMDINKENVELARHNAGVYGVRDYINFMEGDFFNLESQHLNAFESDPV